MDAERFVSAAEQAARKAGRLLKEGLKSGVEVTYKGAINIVTDYDTRAQKIIVDHLASRFPDHDFLAEEDFEADRNREFRWIIDPIDGTNNYAHGFPVFSVSIALQRDGITQVGLVYDPMREELFTGAAGRGSRLNGKKIHVSGEANLARSLLATGFPYDVWDSPDNNVDHFVNFLMRALDIRRCGSAALDLCSVACGRFDGFWELKLKPWDVAAGALIVEEAGGRMSNFEGGGLNIFAERCLASNGLIHDQMLEVLHLGRRASAEEPGP